MCISPQQKNIKTLAKAKPFTNLARENKERIKTKMEVGEKS